MKRKCGACRGLIKERGGLLKCEFGYNTIPGKSYHGIQLDLIPQEECPKPVTVKQYVDELKKHTERNYILNQ